VSDTVEFEVEEVKVETDKAILVEIEGEEYWVPKSQVDDASEVYSKEHGSGTLVVALWWAEQKGLV
jgi:hypothetical protein